jgi:hypothetical protein
LLLFFGDFGSGLVGFFFFSATRCFGPLLTAAVTARSNRSQPSGRNSKLAGFFAMAPIRINAPLLNDHATGIGYLCFMYNGLEVRVNHLLGLLANLDDQDLECFTNQFDLLKKLPTLRGLAFQKKPSQLWFDDIDLMAWAISSQIIPKRNRYVHDIWLGFDEGAVRRHERTRIEKTQSRQEAKLTTYEHIPTTADEIWELVQDTKDVGNILRHLYSAFKSGRAGTEPEAAFPQQYRDQWRARRTPPKESCAEAPRGPSAPIQE